MTKPSTSRAGAWLRWGVTALALLAIALWASTWVVKVSWRKPLQALDSSPFLTMAREPVLYGLVREGVVYRGAKWDYEFHAPPVPLDALNKRSPKLSVDPVGLSGSPFPFVPGTVTTVTSSPLAGLFFAPAGAAAALWASWYIRRRMVPPGHCQACRYDLTAVPGDTCPECGGTGTRVQTADRCV